MRRGPVQGAEVSAAEANGIAMGLGSGRAGYLTTDLSYDYVRINADYRT